MSGFRGNLTITELEPTWEKWRLETDVVYDLGDGSLITVPKGFITDGASVPRPLWDIVPAWGRYSRAAVLHDFLCRMIDRGKPHRLAPDRHAADALFLQAMIDSGVNTAVRNAMWAAVRGYSIALQSAEHQNQTLNAQA